MIASVSVEQIDPFSLPSVALGQRGKLPAVSGIYFAILGTDILYVGKSVNMHQRWRQTRKKLRIIAAHKDEKIVETLDRLATEELRRVEAALKDSESGKTDQD